MKGARTLSLNGTIYKEGELLALCEKKLGRKGRTPAWEKELYQFMQEWLSDAPSIEAATSGSSGTPKILELPKSKMVNSAYMTGEYLGLSRGDRALLCLSAGHMAGKMMLVRAFVLGLDLVVVEPSGDPMKYLSSEFHARFAAMVPLQVHNIFQNNDSLQRFQHLDKVIIGGGAVSDSLHRRIRMVKNDVYATYGMTETLTHVALQKLNGSDASSCFEALEGVTLDQDEEGRLLVKAPHLSDKPVHTNDIVQFEGKGKFHWWGRFDNVINTGGVKVFPEQLERKVENVLDRRSFIAGIPDQKFGEKVVLLIEGPTFDEATMSLFEGHLRDELEPPERPRGIYFLDRFHETRSGKIDRNATLELFRSQRSELSAE